MELWSLCIVIISGIELFFGKNFARICEIFFDFQKIRSHFYEREVEYFCVIFGAAKLFSMVCARNVRHSSGVL